MEYVIFYSMFATCWVKSANWWKWIWNGSILTLLRHHIWSEWKAYVHLSGLDSHMDKFVLDPLNSGELAEKLEQLHWHRIKNRDVKFNCHCPPPSVQPSRTSAGVFLFDQGFVFLVKKKKKKWGGSIYIFTHVRHSCYECKLFLLFHNGENGNAMSRQQETQEIQHKAPMLYPL